MSDIYFKPKQVSKNKILKNEASTANFIPYQTFYNAKTVILKNGWLMQVVKVDGFSFETADDEDVDIKKEIRNSLFKGIAAGKFAIYFHTMRKKKNIFENLHTKPQQAKFAQYIEKEWRKKYVKHRGYSNDLYISVVRKFDTKGAAIVEHLWNKLEQSTIKDGWKQDLKQAYQDLEELTTRIVTSFRDYGPEILGVVKTKDGVYSEILEFINMMVNCYDDKKILAPKTNIDHYIANNRMYFGSNSIEIRTNKGSKYAAIVSIKEYGPSTNAGMLDGFLQMPFEFIITQSFVFSNRQVAINSMQLQQNRMIQAEDKAVSQILEISKALDMAQSGSISFGSHHLTVLCFADTPRELDSNVSMAVVELSNCGITAVREDVNMEPCFWGQLPGNADYIARATTINTLNLAGFASLHNYPIGSETNNHWGEAVTVFETTSGTPYFFNFHLRDVGHTMIVGPTGAGKTVLMNFLCAQAQKFNCRMFFFDKDRGAEIFIRAIGGQYSVIDPSEICGLNPLLLEENGDNKTFLIDWLKNLITANGGIINAVEAEVIAQAINGNFKLDKHDRRLSNIVPFLGIEGPDSLATRIKMWHGNGSHANVFDNDHDIIDFSKSSIFGFEMGKLLKDQATLGPALLYLFHRISMSLDGSPTMIVLDEAWALIDNDVFAPKIKDWLKVMRKLNCMVVFATQSVEDTSNSRISDTLIQQTATQIFLPNLKATNVYRSTFMLSEREYMLIKTTDPGTRFFLVKQGHDAVIARIDLRGMEDIIGILSGRAETVGILDEVIAEHGENPDNWLPIFTERIRKIDD